MNAIPVNFSNSAMTLAWDILVDWSKGSRKILNVITYEDIFTLSVPADEIVIVKIKCKII